jgi:membrane fusion protein, multidrug efflux system
MKKIWVSAGVVVVLAVAAGGAYVAGVLPGAGLKSLAAAGGKDGKDDKKDVTLEFTPGEIAQPQLARLSARLEFSGPLVAPSTAVVRARASGTLLALTVAEGSRVRAGQALGRIDLADQSSRRAEPSASVESARASLVQAERTHASNERLAAQQFISPIALDNSRAAVDTARAALNAAQAATETARIGMRDSALVSPISGIVAKRHVVPGEKLSMEQQVLTIVDLARLELAGVIGTHEVSRLSPGMPVQVQVEGVSQPVAGRIARIAPAAEPGTRSIGVTIELANPQETLRAGQYAVARVELADDVQRLTLPVAAVGNTSGQDHVWIIEGGQLARRAVKLGRRDEREGRVEVVEGVLPTSQVLAARFDNLREGTKAAVVATKAPAVASAAASTPPVK